MTGTDNELLALLRDALVTGDAASASPVEMVRLHEAAASGGAGVRCGAGALAGATSRVRLAWEAWRALPPRLSPALVGAAAALGVLGFPVSSPALVAAGELDGSDCATADPGRSGAAPRARQRSARGARAKRRAGDVRPSSSTGACMAPLPRTRPTRTG